MVQWFQERYISREEHQRVVDYYRKLVAQLYGNVCDLRALAEMQVAEIPPVAEEPAKAADKVHESGPDSNVIDLSSYRDRRRSGVLEAK